MKFQSRLVMPAALVRFATSGLLTIAILAVALTGCGGTPAHVSAKATSLSEGPRGPADPTAVLARVGTSAITGATFNRLLRAELSNRAESEALVPPQFSACVARLQAESATVEEPTVSGPQLKDKCRAQYDTLLQQVLDRLIGNEWLIGEARELGAKISAHQVNASVKRFREESFSDEHEFQSYLAGRTSADVELETRAKLAADAIRRVVKKRTLPPTSAQIASYYKQHSYQYLVAAQRDLQIVRTMSGPAARRARSEIEAGQSFAYEAKKLHSVHVLYSEEGLVVGLRPHVYGEPGLDQAIFTASPGVLTGPLDTSYGFFVFRVTKVRIERKKPLADVRAVIERQLAARLQQQTLVSFAARASAKWVARTSCSRGEVVPDCRQFRGSPGAAAGILSGLS